MERAEKKTALSLILQMVLVQNQQEPTVSFKFNKIEGKLLQNQVFFITSDLGKKTLEMKQKQRNPIQRQHKNGNFNKFWSR